MTINYTITEHLRRLIREELLEHHPGARKVMGMDNKHVLNDRKVRVLANGESQPLLFQGNPYTIIWLNKLQWRTADGQKRDISLAVVRKAWENVRANHFRGDRLVMDGQEHQLLFLDPDLALDGRLLVGYTGIHIPVTSQKLAFPPKPF